MNTKTFKHQRNNIIKLMKEAMEDLQSPHTQSKYAKVMASTTPQSPQTVMSPQLHAQSRFLFFKLHHTISLGDPASGPL